MSHVADAPDEEEEVADDKPRSLIFHLVKQLTKGQDLTRVLIPTFFLEPRSLLEKFSDLWAHPQYILPISDLQDPVERMLCVVKWYLSGWHIRPKGAKKPYNPLLGEVFFCYFDHGDSKSYYLAEQVSHHPPVSAIYLENRRRNIALNAQIWTKSKFLGNSAASIPIGECMLHVCNLNETYIINFPTVYACGLFIGKLRMELGGEQTITCAQTGLTADIEFRTKPMIGGDYNRVRGQIRRESQKKSQFLYKIDGKWDSEIHLITPEDKKLPLFSVDDAELCKKYVTKLEAQGEWESRKVWNKVTLALKKNDHDAATVEKSKLEDAQRERAKEREEKGIEYKTKYFHLNDEKKWIYNKMNLRPFDPNNEDPDADPPIAVVEVEEDDLAKNATLRVVPVHNADSKHNEEDPMSANARSMSVIQPPPHAHHPHGTAHAADDSTLVSKHTH